MSKYLRYTLEKRYIESNWSSSRAFIDWKKSSAEDRSFLLKKLYSLVIKNKKLAKIITLECGKPLKESLVEVEYGASL